VQLSGGQANTQVVLKIVQDTLRGRIYTITGNGATAGSGIVNVWFNVIATREGLVGGTTACGHTIVANDQFVALPSTGLCNKAVVLRNGSNTATTSVLEVGPWFPNSAPSPGNPCVGGNDPYWNTSGIPRTESTTCDSNNAGIDLADGTFFGLGLTGNARILWRFN